GAVKKYPLLPDCQTPASWLIWFTSIAGSVACIRMQSLIRGNQTRTTGWLLACTRICGPMRLLIRNYGARLPMN
ncbi:replication protein P, partial [Escherichia coli H223]